MPSSDERLQRIFESEVVGIIEVDETLRITRVNKGLLTMLGYSIDELLQKTIADITHPEDMDAIQREWQRLVAGENHVRYEKRYVAKDGSLIHCLVGIQCGSRDANGWPTWFLGFISPMTEILAARSQAEKLTQKLDAVYRETAGALARAIEARDAYTAGHQEGVAMLAVGIGEQMGLDSARLYGIYLAGTVHDIGKIGVPPEFLSKVTKLTSLEMDFIKQHAAFGYDILKGVESPWPLAQTAYQHHERLDGTGYPNKLMRSDILLEARIVAVADLVDSMIKPRPYRPARTISQTRDALFEGRSRHYDADAVDACLRLDVLADGHRSSALS